MAYCSICRQVRTSLMHIRECLIVDKVSEWKVFGDDQYPRKFIELIKSQTFTVGSQALQFHENQSMWNAGVLGLTKEVASLMPDIFAVNDFFYTRTEWILSEQAAFSLLLLTKTRLLPSDRFVFHYWKTPQKVSIDKLLPKFISKQLTELTLSERLTQIRTLTIKLPRVIELDGAQRGAIDAFSNGNLLVGAKQVTKFMLISLFRAKSAKNLLPVFKQKQRS